MISDTWKSPLDPENDPDSADDAEEDADALFRPVWEDEPDETDTDRLGPPGWSVPARPTAENVSGDFGGLTGENLAVLLGPLCAAQDALSRLDARTAAAPDALREGLTARLALWEAAGWLAHTQSWVHPLDLALRDLDLTGSYAVSAGGGGAKNMPQTYEAQEGAAWDEQTFEEISAVDRAVSDALALARVLRRIAHSRTWDPFAGETEAAALVNLFGAGEFDADKFAAWREMFSRTGAERARPDHRSQAAPIRLPPLLRAAQAGENWMQAGITAPASPVLAGLAATATLVRQMPLRAGFLPVWGSYPSIGKGDRDALPHLRTEAARRLGVLGMEWGWPLTFLLLIAEGARAGLRELDRLEDIAARAAEMTAGGDRRSRLADAVEAALRTPAITPKALAGRLKIAPQTATALLRELQRGGIVREVTGRRSFRAFAV